MRLNVSATDAKMLLIESGSDKNVITQTTSYTFIKTKRRQVCLSRNFSSACGLKFSIFLYSGELVYMFNGDRWDLKFYLAPF